ETSLPVATSYSLMRSLKSPAASNLPSGENATERTPRDSRKTKRACPVLTSQTRASPAVSLQPWAEASSVPSAEKTALSHGSGDGSPGAQGWGRRTRPPAVRRQPRRHSTLPRLGVAGTGPATSAGTTSRAPQRSAPASAPSDRRAAGAPTHESASWHAPRRRG